MTMLKPLTVLITANCAKFLKWWEYQTTSPGSWKICMQLKKQQFEPDMEQQTGSKFGKEYVKAVYCHPAYLTDIQSDILQWLVSNSWYSKKLSLWNQRHSLSHSELCAAENLLKWKNRKASDIGIRRGKKEYTPLTSFNMTVYTFQSAAKKIKRILQDCTRL